MREAVNIAAERIAGPEDVDLTLRTGFGLRVRVCGRFEHAEVAGLVWSSIS
jgi:3-hydroxyacyl-CoA dehydrogenase